MFIGHWAPALVASTHPKAPKLWILFVGGQLVDFAFFTFVLLGIEHMRIVPGITKMVPFDLYHMPWTHSLLGTVGWAAALGALVWWLLQSRIAGLLAGAVVVSHWLLDLLVHRQDLTLVGTPPKLGLGLWNHPWIAMPLELGITLAALLFYKRRTEGKMLPFMVMAGVLLVLQLGNWFGEQAREMSAQVPITGLVAFTIPVLLAWWLGTSRTLRATQG
ncbi:MAG: hypothetical protein H6918_09230 [Sphingomonadaceae bacterium]|nr:hypothetical protein [Sphingomonadaceae bacterium]